MSDVQDLSRLVQKLSREAEKASRAVGRRELDALQVTTAQYQKLYQDLKSQGVIE